MTGLSVSQLLRLDLLGEPTMYTLGLCRQSTSGKGEGERDALYRRRSCTSQRATSLDLLLVSDGSLLPPTSLKWEVGGMWVSLA